jgi:UDP-N-acetylglucosamine acyltransferase
MGGARIGPGAVLGDGTTVAPYVVLEAGVEVHDRAFVSGLVVVQQGVRIGRLAFVSGLSVVHRDAPPFMFVGGRPAITVAPNMRGLRRAGFSAAAREALKQAYKQLFRGGDPDDAAIDRVGGAQATPEVLELVDFVRAARTRSRPVANGTLI